MDNNTEQINDNMLNENMLNESNISEDLNVTDDIVADDTVLDIDLNDSISSTSSSEQCAICLDTIIKDEECINNCGHKFCKPCMDQYLDLGKIECPLCRQKILYFEHNSEHYRLILKKVNQRQVEPRDPNTLVIDRKKFNVFRFIFMGLFVTNIINMFMGDVYTNQLNYLLRQYQECERNNTDLQNDILNLEGTITELNTYSNSDYGYYFIIDKFRGLQSECYLPVNIINTCFNIF